MVTKEIDSIKILHYDLVESTNSVALSEKNAEHLLTVVADEQTGGRGRMGRSFYSYYGGLYMSVVIDCDRLTVPYNLCTPAAAVAVREALSENGVDNIKIKWVNDLLIDDKKICGILTEARSEGGRLDRLVVGIGINLSRVREIGFPDEISDKAGVALFDGDRLALASRIAKRLGELIEGDGKIILDNYRMHLARVGKDVYVTDYSDGNKKTLVKLLGIDDNCYLKVLMGDGTEKTMSSGEII